jgi:hypothetical protein
MAARTVCVSSSIGRTKEVTLAIDKNDINFNKFIVTLLFNYAVYLHKIKR